jgi:hypothetical protein
MKFGKFIHAIAPLAAIAFAGAISGCDKVDFNIDGKHVKFNGKEGVKLSELDLTGKAPEELALLGPDEVRVTEGAKLAITVEGDGKDEVRFALDGDTLGILRGNNSSAGRAIINVTLPALREVSMLGSGRIVTGALAPNAKIVVAGSGEIETGAVSGDKLEVTIPGSGRFRANGNAGKLELTVLGSGAAELDALKVEKAEVTMAGSGRARFASDGEVEATILGSGEVTVIGRARCKLNSVGSGRLVCENGTQAADAPTPPTPPAPPAPPAPKAN